VSTKITSTGKELAVAKRKAVTVIHGSGKPTHCPYSGKDGLRDNGETARPDRPVAVDADDRRP